VEPGSRRPGETEQNTDEIVVVRDGFKKQLMRKLQKKRIFKTPLTCAPMAGEVQRLKWQPYSESLVAHGYFKRKQYGALD